MGQAPTAPVRTEGNGTNEAYYYYSTPYQYRGVNYVIATGAKAAQLIAFLLETNPFALNASSEFYHFRYNQDGSMSYEHDEKGRQVKSVGSSDVLQELCETNDIQSIYVFDKEGRTIGTNTKNWYFTISRKEGDQSYDFLQVLDGRTDSLVQAPLTDDLGESTQYVGVAFHYYTKEDENGNVVYVSRYKANAPEVTAHRAMIQIGLDAAVSAELTDAAEVAYLLPNFLMEDGYISMFSLGNENRCLYSLMVDETGKTAEELGIPEAVLTKDSYCKVEGSDYNGKVTIFQQCDGYLFQTVIMRGSVFRARGIIALTTALIALLLMLILCATVTLTSREEENLYSDEYWRPERFRWFSGNPEEKLVQMIRVVAEILMICVVAAAVFAEKNFAQHSMIRFVLGDSWDRGLNIFAFSKSVLVLVGVFFGVSVLRIPLKLLPSLFGARGETIGHLLISVVKYTGVLAALFYTLYLFGLDSKELIASAGLLTLIIGFGAQSLIKDIISGLFIVFEGTYHVGDIVTIHGHRGIVYDISLRNTKVLGLGSEEGNLKVISNSTIDEALNMSFRPSNVSCKVGIDYGQELAYVEEVVKRELPAIGLATPEILTGPFFRGVSNLDESCVELLFACTCLEKDVGYVRRTLYRGILEMFYQYDINIPYPNVTVSQQDTSGRKTIEDLPDVGEDNPEP